MIVVSMVQPRRWRNIITPSSNSDSVLQEPQDPQGMNDGRFHLLSQLDIFMFGKANLHPDATFSSPENLPVDETLLSNNSLEVSVMNSYDG